MELIVTVWTIWNGISRWLPFALFCFALLCFISMSSMWDQHKKHFGKNCNESCPCAWSLGVLTANVVQDYLADRLRNAGDGWISPQHLLNLDPGETPTGFSTNFANNFTSSISDRWTLSPMETLKELCLIWPVSCISSPTVAHIRDEIIVVRLLTIVPFSPSPYSFMWANTTLVESAYVVASVLIGRRPFLTAWRTVAKLKLVESVTLKMIQIHQIMTDRALHRPLQVSRWTMILIPSSRLDSLRRLWIKIHA